VAVPKTDTPGSIEERRRDSDHSARRSRSRGGRLERRMLFGITLIILTSLGVPLAIWGARAMDRINTALLSVGTPARR
jgi:hypothetical protein